MQFPTVLGTWGMREFVEPRIRSLVSDHLGVGIETLASVASLRDDLAADSLDLLELALLLEREFAIAVSDSALQGMHSYDDLVGTVVRLIVEARDAAKKPEEDLPRVRVRLLPPDQRSSGTLWHAGVLTPYTAETIDRHAHLAGPGAHLEITVAAATSDAGLARVRRRFAHLPLSVIVGRSNQIEQTSGTPASGAYQIAPLPAA